MKPTNFAYHLSEYLGKHLPGRTGLSENTIMSYRDTFTLLLRYCRDIEEITPEKITFACLTKELLERFLNYLAKDRGCSDKTVNQRLSAIHAFFSYVQTEVPEEIFHCQQILAIDFKKVPRGSFVEHVSLDAIEAILAQPNTETLKGRRDLTILALLYDTGARVSEVVGIRVRDVRIDNPATVKLLGKGDKARVTPLMSQTKELLELYIKEQGLTMANSGARPLFFNHRGEKLTRVGIAYILEKHVALAKEKRPNLIAESVSPHVLRHSKAMHLLQNGVNLVYIRDLLGHTDISTTETYARANAEMKRKAIEGAYRSPAPKDLPPWQRDGELLGWLKGLGK
jgi:site-specific recombinase XerD